MEIQNDTEKSKFVMNLEQAEARIDYKRGPGNCYNLLHTIVPPEAQGQGIASKLVAAAVATAKKEKVKVVATCSYVQKWFENHPEEKPILETTDTL